MAYPTAAQRIALPHEQYRGDARDFDLLLWRPKGLSLFGRAITLATAGPYSHASVAYWCAGRLWSLEYSEGVGGGHARLLSADVRRWSGAIDVFRVPDFEPPEQTGELIGQTLATMDLRYSWTAIAAFLLGVAPVTRLFPALRRRVARAGAFVCSTWAAHVYQHILGVQLVDGPPMDATPNDLARSRDTQYRGTLEWQETATAKAVAEASGRRYCETF